MMSASNTCVRHACTLKLTMMSVPKTRVASSCLKCKRCACTLELNMMSTAKTCVTSLCTKQVRVHAWLEAMSTDQTCLFYIANGMLHSKLIVIRAAKTNVTSLRLLCRQYVCKQCGCTMGLP